MPIFEYHCKDCETHFERIVMGAPKPIECPECSNPKVEKLISSFAVSATSSTQALSRTDCACNPGTT